MIMKNRNIISKALIVFFCLLVLAGCKKNSVVTNEGAEQEKNKKRFITVINATDLIIDDVIIEVGEGTEVQTYKKPEEKSFSIEIDDAWIDQDTFKVILIDTYGLHYEKETFVSETGRTEIKITQDDYKEYQGDWFRKLVKKLNGNK